MIITKRVNISSLFFSFPNTRGCAAKTTGKTDESLFNPHPPPSFFFFFLLFLFIFCNVELAQSLSLNQPEDSTFFYS